MTFRKEIQIKGLGAMRRVGGVNNDSDVARACRDLDFARGPSVVVPRDPETEPEAIREAQRADVRAALRRGILTPEKISEVTILPVGVVNARLAEIRSRRKRAVV